MTDPSSVTSLWPSITSWFTPTTLFLFLNLVIGTIAVTSRFNSNRRPRHQLDQLRHHGSHGQLARAPSLLDRVKSIDFSLYRFPNQEQEQQSNFFQHHAKPGYDTNPVETQQPQLGRAPSLLDRVQSINLSLYNFPNQTEEQEEQQQQFFHRNIEPAYETNPVEPEQFQLARAPSFLERVKSINISSVYRSRQTHHETEREVINNPEKETSPDHNRKRSKSETKKVKPRVQGSINKSVSEKSMMVEKEDEDEHAVERRRPQTARLERTVTVGDGDHGVDAKANDFINKFKRDLRLQRLDSLWRKQEIPQGG